jgi:hypothetical protein
MRQLSERRGTAISSLEIPSPQYGGSDGFERRSPGSRSPASSTRYSPQYPSEGKLNPRSPGKVVPGARRTGTGGSGRGGTKKGRWRPRVKGVARFLFAFLLVYFFGRTAYQLSFFVKAGLGRYWFYPLATQRPDLCGPRTPPADVLLTSLVPIAGTGTAITTERDTRIGGAFGDRDASFEARSFDDGLSEGAALGARAGRKLAGGGGGDGAASRRHGPRVRRKGNSAAAASDEAGSALGGSPALGGGAEVGSGAVAAKRRFGVLTLCDANAGYICTASAANKRRYTDLHGYDLIVSTEVADPSRPAAWSKILEVKKHLPRYDWLLFIDVDTLIMNPSVRLEDIADETVDQVIAADHNGVNSGVWLVRNSEWSMFFLDELWAQEHLVRGPYLFHYEQRAFHHLFQTTPWARQKSVKGKEPYAGAAAVRAHSKIVNQCVFNSLLPWYVSGDFVVHFAGLKGVWECLIFWHYFDLSQQMPGMHVSDKQWGAEIGGAGGGRGKPAQLWRCMKFQTLF